MRMGSTMILTKSERMETQKQGNDTQASSAT